MSAYNTLTVNSKCCNCKKETEIKIQFKFGDTWDYEYRLGDAITWGGNDVGKKDAKKVVVDGTAEECIHCGSSVDYLIFVENDVIKSFEKNSGQFDFNHSEGYYLILK